MNVNIEKINTRIFYILKIQKFNIAKRRRRSANIRPEPVYRPSKSAVPKRNINKLDVRKAYKTPRQALAEVTYDEGENTISLVPRNHGKRARYSFIIGIALSLPKI